jgi:hypothetical protein
MEVRGPARNEAMFDPIIPPPNPRDRDHFMMRCLARVTALADMLAGRFALATYGDLVEQAELQSEAVAAALVEYDTLCACEPAFNALSDDDLLLMILTATEEALREIIDDVIGEQDGSVISLSIQMDIPACQHLC